jgi:hypothetical protein
VAVDAGRRSLSRWARERGRPTVRSGARGGPRSRCIGSQCWQVLERDADLAALPPQRSKKHHLAGRSSHVITFSAAPRAATASARWTGCLLCRSGTQGQVVGQPANEVAVAAAERERPRGPAGNACQW